MGRISTGMTLLVAGDGGAVGLDPRVHLLARLSGDVGQGVHLVVLEARELPEAAGQAHGAVLLLAAEATEAEQLVDHALELEGPLLARLVVRGELAEPVGAHLHVGDLVGEHPVLAELEHRVAGDVAELAHRVEHVDGEPFEGAVHAGEAQHGIGVAGGLVEEGALAELAELGAHVAAELDADLAVAGLVPALAGHVELELEGHLGDALAVAAADLEVPARAAGALEGLDLADEDAVHQPAGGVGRVGTIGGEATRAVALGRAAAGDLRGARVVESLHHRHPDEAVVAGQILDGEGLPHAWFSSSLEYGSPMVPGPVMPPAASSSFCSLAWWSTARCTASSLSMRDCSIISPSRQSSSSSARQNLSERMVGASVIVDVLLRWYVYAAILAGISTR